MPREIKFRAWDSLENRMLFEPNFPYYSSKKSKTFSLMQYTGLKDKNGKEIYEGDILRGAGIVEWNQDEVRWSCIDIEWNDRRERHDMLYLTTPLEVIGNIYENPELLC